MKRGYEGTPSTSFGPPKSKLRYDSYDGSRASEDESFNNARRVADHYSARSNQTLEEREASPIIHLKKLNNWIKSVLIQLYAHPKDAVLDIACGKGGDLIKWDKARIGYYVGVDIAEGSIKDCRTRYNGDSDQQQRRKKFSFPARLICADFYEVRLDKYLHDDAPFDVCSCQFALHYSWSTEARARQALANVSALLQPGGTFIGTMPDANVIIKRLREAEGLEFGNSVYWICFDEEYSSKDAVDCPEWIVPFHVFKSLAQEDLLPSKRDRVPVFGACSYWQLVHPKVMPTSWVLLIFAKEYCGYSVFICSTLCLVYAIGLYTTRSFMWYQLSLSVKLHFLLSLVDKREIGSR
ncbi:mRNA cap guanine-N7 methyltransferase 1-like isoform X4 [Musa acuminata AAA Group]|uniref:mRNA cap guanine-N7 methyltransferase 1-like isoform X4 n=1 Tax=Musa acuminata AAA Group TaxID=214697 RepID=UPI0031E0F41F